MFDLMGEILQCTDGDTNPVRMNVVSKPKAENEDTNVGTSSPEGLDLRRSSQ